jgi:hypothetical protein
MMLDAPMVLIDAIVSHARRRQMRKAERRAIRARKHKGQAIATRLLGGRRESELYGIETSRRMNALGEILGISMEAPTCLVWGSSERLAVMQALQDQLKNCRNNGEIKAWEMALSAELRERLIALQGLLWVARTAAG